MKYISLFNRALVKITGDESADFLQSIISNDIRRLEEEKIIYTLLLTPQGKFLFDFFITKDGEDFLLECNKSRRDELIAKLKLYKLRRKIDITICDDYKLYAIDGDFGYDDPRTKGFFKRAMISIDRELNGKEISYADYEIERIKNAIPEGDKDMKSEKSFPLEFGMDNFNAISFDKGCYIGQEVTTRTKKRGVVRKKVIYANQEMEGELLSQQNEHRLYLARLV